MADNTGRNINEEEEFLKLQKQISKAAKDAGKSWEQMGNYTKTVAANYVEMQKMSLKMRDIQKEINKLENARTDAEKQRRALLEQELQDLTKQRQQLLEINKEMVKPTKLITMGLSGIVTYLGKAATGYLEFSQKSRDTAATIGLSRDNMNMLQKNIEMAGTSMLRYGVTHEQALEAQQAFSEELGRSVILSRQTFENMAMVGKATGLGMQGMAGMVSQMNQFGFGAEKATEYVYDMYAQSSAMGLNAGKVLKKFEQNLGLLNKLNFKNGVDGLKKMAQFSEKYKLDMQSVAAVADKVFRPEGAIEAAAQLQVLGGSLASLGDPFTLMYKARNAPEELTKNIAKAAAASAKFNEKTGEFEVNAYEMDRMKEAAQALGLSMEEMVKSAKQTAMLDKMGGFLSGKNLDPEQKEALAMMAQMKDGKAVIEFKGETKELAKMSEQDLLAAINEKKKAKDAADQATGLMERLSNFMNQLLTAIYPLFHELEKNFQPLVDALTDKTSDWAESLKKFFAKLNPGKLIEDIKNFFVNAWNTIKDLALNWKSTLIKGGLLFVGAWVAAQLPAAIAFATTAGGLLKSIFGRFGGGGGGGNQTPNPAGGGFMNSLGSAVQILAVGAALMMLAKALDIFGDAMLKLQKVPPSLLLGVGTGLLVFVGALGLLGSTGIGEIGVAIMLGVGAALLMIGGAVWLAAQGLSVLVDSFTNMFDVIGPNGDSAMKAGFGFIMMATGIGILTASLIALSATSLLAIPGLMVLGATSMMIVATANSLANIGTKGLKDSIDAINKVDTDKLEALKDLSIFMALLGSTTTIKFDESLKVSGSIELTGEAGGKTNTDWVNDPIFVRKVKRIIETSKSTDRDGR